MEETAAQVCPPKSDNEQSKENESKSEESTALLDVNEANGNDMPTDLKPELDWRTSPPVSAATPTLRGKK